MYEFSPATDRILNMREKIRDRVIYNDAERTQIITEVYKKYDHVVPIIQRSLAFKALCEKISVWVGDDELIVGCKGPHFFSSPQYPEWGVTDWIVEPIMNGEWKIGEDGLYHNPDGEEIKHVISPEDYEIIRDSRSAQWPTHGSRSITRS